MIEETIKIEVDGADGKHSCRLLEKSNNQNGQTVYTFRDEVTSKDFLICKHGNEWRHLQGELPAQSCIKELGDYLDKVDKK